MSVKAIRAPLKAAEKQGGSRGSLGHMASINSDVMPKHKEKETTMYVMKFKCLNACCGYTFVQKYSVPVAWTDCPKCGARAESGVEL